MRVCISSALRRLDLTFSNQDLKSKGLIAVDARCKILPSNVNPRLILSKPIKNVTVYLMILAGESMIAAEVAGWAAAFRLARMSANVAWTLEGRAFD